ncbi:GNAT family N-acetyltransferase [Cellulomonas terrae]|uniref:N-acetyltransferase n=1 Tax=Cellulomonas terrae TaxID=311234 RepID=A0A511JIV0_9CELL|nr:GNAT family protein [Cellulomonas terrae]GEL97942.1 N-acetyltransferase [Cellulomonas terrae]
MLHDLTLEGHGTRLVPLADEHAEPLSAFVDDCLWAGMSSPTPGSPAAMRSEIRTADAAPGRLAFAVVDAGTGVVRGSTSFYDLDLRIGRVEIGHTFYDPRWWGTTNNPSCKLLLLTHAFETWGCARVAFRADARNARSIAAIRRLGAVPEGVLRSHRLAPDGSRGDSAYFSILPDEWPAVRAGLEARLSAAG